MVNRNLIRSLDDDEIINELAVLAPEEEADEWLLEWLEQEQQDYAQGEIVDGFNREAAVGFTLNFHQAAF